jgi:hypothetical protein
LLCAAHPTAVSPDHERILETALLQHHRPLYPSRRRVSRKVIAFRDFLIERLQNAPLA